MSLVILLALSLLAIITLSPSLRETNKTNEMYSAQIAEIAANSAMNSAKMIIQNTAKKYGATDVCLHILCAARIRNRPQNPTDFLNINPTQATINEYQTGLPILKGKSENMHSASPSIYVIEDLGDLSVTGEMMQKNSTHSLRSFRITTRGVGNTGKVLKVIEGIYSVQE
ncbi:hypothetical protein ELE36_11310 [Pseudolysobacter antarcticus]|uniref:Uncharacterized protein n=1 Tax=Pseudolysobacter antarcticus TaxID=2511995 RepID=A0A411HKH2_9GAMM|nr:hypothetical protein [Pseudolysobacter antarcticus]QBB70890.1 hypothetical protein ELE36_11310 [Pseudolysobacter antarcticus]